MNWDRLAFDVTGGIVGKEIREDGDADIKSLTARVTTLENMLAALMEV